MQYMIAVVAALAWHPAPTPASVASNYWPQSPCHGREVVRFVDELAPGLEGWAAQDDCTVQVLRRVDRYPAHECQLLIHEFGHLAGREHTLGGVMDPRLPVMPGPCKRFPFQRKERQ
jgi:hypothetical protein